MIEAPIIANTGSKKKELKSPETYRSLADK